MIILDYQLAKYGSQLENEVGISKTKINQVGTLISKELENLSDSAIKIIQDNSPIELEHRYKELLAFQRMMDFLNNNKFSEPGLIRCQVITQNYICFVYLKDNFFKSLQNVTKPDSIIFRCCNFLTSARIRRFRNSISHGNWNYNKDYSGLEFWDHKKNEKTYGYEKYELTQDELSFWQTLSRVVAYSAIESIMKRIK